MKLKLKRFEGWKERFWFKEKVSQHQTSDGTQGAITRKRPSHPLEEDAQEEIEERNKMWLIEKITSLEEEKEEMTNALQEMSTRVRLKENMLNQVERHGSIEATLEGIGESVQRLNNFTESATATINGLVQDVQKHQGSFREVGRVLLNREEHITKTRTASEQMAQRINALIQESEKNHLWIGNPMKENQEQNNVLRRHEIGQYAIAEVIKDVANKQSQQPQPQTANGTGPTITEPGEDGAVLDFLGGQNPNTGTPRVRHNSANAQFRQRTIPLSLVPILYLCFVSRWFSIFCLDVSYSQ